MEHLQPVQSRDGSDFLSYAILVTEPCCFAGAYTGISARSYTCWDVPFQPGFLGGTGQTLPTDLFLRGSCCVSECLLCILLNLLLKRLSFENWFQFYWNNQYYFRKSIYHQPEAICRVFQFTEFKKKIKKIFGFCSRLIEAFLTVKIAKSKNKSHSCDHRKGKADAGQKAGRFTSCIDAISRHPTASEKGARAQRPPLADVFLAMSWWRCVDDVYGEVVSVCGSGERPQLIPPPSLLSSTLLVTVLEMLPWSGIGPVALACG